MQDQKSSDFAPLASLPSDFFHLEHHPLADRFAMADTPTLSALEASIRERGIDAEEPIILYLHDGKLKVLDGRNRYKAGNAVAHCWRVADFREFKGSYAEAEKLVYKKDLRRHETEEEKKDKVKAFVKEQSGMTLRGLAEVLGVSHTTIANIRRELKNGKAFKKKDDAKYNRLCKDWEDADFGDQEEFVKNYRDDLTELLRN
jgi:DNA-binding XRE family transcriptional regulator